MAHKSLMIEASRIALQPLVRLWLASGVMYQDALRLLKALYIEVATREFGLRGRPTNAARVALLTGLDRKEVGRMRAQAAELTKGARPAPDRLSRVLSAWHQDPAFTDPESGGPRPLPRQGPHPSFETLVEHYGGDVPVTAIAKELERGGAIETDAAGRLVARTRYYMVEPFDEAALLRSGEVLADLGNTVRHNLLRTPDAPSRFEGRATSRHVASAAVPAFRDFVEREGEAFLERVDAWLTAHESRDDRGCVRLGVGLYAIQGPPTAAENHSTDEAS